MLWVDRGGGTTRPGSQGGGRPAGATPGPSRDPPKGYLNCYGVCELGWVGGGCHLWEGGWADFAPPLHNSDCKLLIIAGGWKVGGVPWEVPM
jgi:hypothetical protein